jgi:hypothetical protein
MDSMFQVIEILVKGLGENIKKNQWEVLSQSTPRAQGKADRFKIQDWRFKIQFRGTRDWIPDPGSSPGRSGMTENVSPDAGLAKKTYVCI